MKNNLKRNYLYNLIYRITVMLTPLITSPYISRVLGAEGLGEYSFTYAVAHYFLIFAVLGISDYGSRGIARVKDNENKKNEIFSQLITFQILLALTITILYVFYVVNFAQNKELALIQGINVLSAIFDITWFFFGMELFVITTVRNVIVKVLGVLLMLVFVKTPNDIWKYALIMSSTTLIGQMTLIPLLKKYVKYKKPRFKDVLSHLKPNLILFLPVVANNLLAYFDKIMIGQMSTKAELGCYDNAEKVISIPNSLITALGTVMLPRITNSLAQGKSKQIEKLTEKSMMFTLCAVFAFSFGIAGIAKEFVPVFFGENFDIVVPLIYILVPIMVFVSWASVIKTQCLLPNNMDKVYVRCLILGAMLNVLLNFILIPIYGVLGAAFATAVAEFLIALSETILVRKKCDIKTYLEQGMPFFITGIVMIICIFNIRLSNIWTTLFVKIIIGAFIYLSFTILILKKNHKEIYEQLLKGLKKNEKNNMH